MNREGKASRGETITTGGTRARGHGQGRENWPLAHSGDASHAQGLGLGQAVGASKADCAHKSSPDEDGGGVLPPLCWTPILYVKSDLQSTEICGGGLGRPDFFTGLAVRRGPQEEGAEYQSH